MKHGSTFILKGVVILIGLIVLAACIFALPALIASELAGDFDYGFIFVGLYITAIPFFIALHQTLKLLQLIDKNKVFSTLSIQALRNIKFCALSISLLFAVGMPYIFYVADRDDAPGVAAVAFIIIGASFVIAAAAAVFERLMRSTVDIKSENDLTV